MIKIINGEAFTIKATQKTRQNNPCGYEVKVNDKSYHVNVLTQQEAEDYAFSKYIRENR